ncbi:MAG: ABC transporter substrate-binding protein, partial [Rhodospirillaceae bacterium]
MKWRPLFAVLAVAAIWLAAPIVASAADKQLTIAFQRMVNSWKVAIADRAFEKATGYAIKWRRFASGLDVVKAMALGEVQLASMGSTSIALGVSSGIDIELVWILEDIGAGEALVAREGTASFAPRDLKGKKIGVQLGSTAHFHLLFALEQFGYAPGDVEIWGMQPGAIGTRWKGGSIDAAFVADPVLSEIKRSGRELISSGELSRLGKAAFDGIVVDKTWAKNNPKFMVNFIRTIARADETYKANRSRWTPTSEPDDVPRGLFLYRYPDLAEQASEKWLGGGAVSGAARALYQTSKFLVEQRLLGTLLVDYGPAVNDGWVKA